MDRDVIFAPVDALDRQPVDEFGIGLAADPRRAARSRPPASRAASDRPRIAPSTRARAWRVEPVGRIFEHRLQPPRQRGQRLAAGFERLGSAGGARDQRAVRLGQLGLEPVARFLRLGARVDRAAHLGEQRLDRPERRALGQPLQPAVRRQRLRRLDRRIERAPALFVVGRDVHQPRRQPAPAAARAPFRTDDPAPQLDRFLPAERNGEGRIGGVEQMMALVEQDPAGRILAAARGIDHHQRMVGDDDVGLAARPLGALDEAAAIMRAAGIDAFAAPVGQRGRAGAAEQARQPARQVAADHVAVLACRPPSARPAAPGSPRGPEKPPCSASSRLSRHR